MVTFATELQKNIWRSDIAQNEKTSARSLTRMPMQSPNNERIVSRRPLVKIWYTVTEAVASVHRDSVTPASSQVVPSVCLTGAASASA